MTSGEATAWEIGYHAIGKRSIDMKQKKTLAQLVMDMALDVAKSKRPLTDRDIVRFAKAKFPHLSQEQIANMYGLSL